MKTIGDLRDAIKTCDDGESLDFRMDKGDGTVLEMTGPFSSGGGRITFFVMKRRHDPDRSPPVHPSDIFLDAFDSGCSGCVRDCDCGRTHFADDDSGYDWEEGELEGLRARADDGTGRCIAHDGSVGTISIDGREIVMGCTCGLAARYEDFIAKHAAQIARYLNQRSEDMKKRAEDMRVRDEVDMAFG